MLGWNDDWNEKSGEIIEIDLFPSRVTHPYEAKTKLSKDGQLTSSSTTSTVDKGTLF